MRTMGAGLAPERKDKNGDKYQHRNPEPKVKPRDTETLRGHQPQSSGGDESDDGEPQEPQDGGSTSGGVRVGDGRVWGKVGARGVRHNKSGVGAL